MSGVLVDERPEGRYLCGPRYAVWLPEGKPYALITDEHGQPWMDLFLPSSLHAADRLDDTLRLYPPKVEPVGDGYRVTVAAASTAWHAKRTILECSPDELRLTVVVEGDGALADVHLLGGYYSGDVAHGSGFHQSGADFRSVFNPEPWGSERRVLGAGEATALDVLGSPVPGKEHWLFTPPPLSLQVSRAEPPRDGEHVPEGPWATIGVAAAPGEHRFTAVHYEAVEGAFSLRLCYEGQTQVAGRSRSPTVTLRFGAPDPYSGIAAHTASLRTMGWLPDRTAGAPAEWWSAPIFCGWGSQGVLSAQAGGSPQDHATQAAYDGFLAVLDEQDLRPGTVVLDDKWQRAYGSWEADPGKWPDLRGWIGERHAAGQRVLLWWKAWDPEGVPDALCVRNRDGLPLGVDPSNPGYEAALRESVARMLGADGYDADGLKVDFSARTPSGPGLVRHGRQWGMELLHRLLWIIYDAAKRSKHDALIITHTPHPYFRDVTDMVRLNDVNTRAAVVPQMVHRARVVRAACPDVLIDTDNWPMPSIAEFRAYVDVQPELGVPSLYYATHVDDLPRWTKDRAHVAWGAFAELRAEQGAPFPPRENGHVPLTAGDYELIRRSWARHRSAGHG